MAHRIEPLHGTMHAQTKRRFQSNVEVQQQLNAEVQQRSQNYAFMLRSLMVMIQEYLLLSDDNIQSGAVSSSDLVRRPPQLREHNKICIWLQDLRPVR